MENKYFINRIYAAASTMIHCVPPHICGGQYTEDNIEVFSK